MTLGVQLALSVDDLLAKSRQLTGIDIIDEAAVAPLTVYVKSLNEDSQLHASGAKGMQGKILRHLSNRLRMKRDFARHPQIADQKLNAPIFLCGMGRTGSTKTQKLLASSGDFNWLPYWQTLNPSLISGSREESTDARIADSDDFTQWFDRSSPETKYGHAFESHEPEEESLVLEHRFMSPVVLGWAPLDSYLGWLMAQDLTSQFVYLRDTLKYLQWQGLAHPQRRWILRCPLYSGLEPLLLSVFPDACLMMTHRHPNETIASSLKLLECFHKPFTDSHANPEFFLAGMAGSMDAHLQHRSAMGDQAILDLHFKEIVGSVPTLIEKVYAFAGVKLTEASRQRMLDWNKINVAHKTGKFVYSLADYNMTEAIIEQRFAKYIEFLRQKYGG